MVFVLFPFGFSSDQLNILQFRRTKGHIGRLIAVSMLAEYGLLFCTFVFAYSCNYYVPVYVHPSHNGAYIVKGHWASAKSTSPANYTNFIYHLLSNKKKKANV